jgi:hypothetical protein
MVIDAVLTTSRCTSWTGCGPCWGGASGAPAATPSFKLAAGALSGSDGPAQAVRTPIVATAPIANVNHVRFNLQEIRLIQPPCHWL